MRRDTVRARYVSGTIGSRQVPSYVDERGVDPSRNTETYAALTLEVNSPRWAGAPFTLRSGKALAADAAEIAIHFRPLPRYLLDQFPGAEPNVLRLGLTEPYVRLATTLNGPDRTAVTRNLETRSAAPRFSAYAHLIAHMLGERPDAVHPRRRGRGGLAHHRSRHEARGPRVRSRCRTTSPGGARRDRRMDSATA